jgi:zinc D-Ala-D-Ala carboxypeptidase
MKITENFTLEEFCKSDLAIRKGISNTPDIRITESLTNLITYVLQPLRNRLKLPITINSGYRSPELNDLVGGSKTSQHMRGEAADIEIMGMDNVALANYIKGNCPFDQLILEFYTPGDRNSGWVHVSYSKTHMRKSVLTASLKDGKTVYTEGINA